MNQNDPLKQSSQNPPKVNALLFPPEHAVAFYTLLSILIKMKQELGLEAMLQYMGKYINTIDAHNPRVCVAVRKALDLIPIEIIFKEMNTYDEHNNKD